MMVIPAPHFLQVVNLFQQWNAFMIHVGRDCCDNDTSHALAVM